MTCVPPRPPTFMVALAEAWYSREKHQFPWNTLSPLFQRDYTAACRDLLEAAHTLVAQAGGQALFVDPDALPGQRRLTPALREWLGYTSWRATFEVAAASCQMSIGEMILGEEEVPDLRAAWHRRTDRHREADCQHGERLFLALVDELLPQISYWVLGVAYGSENQPEAPLQVPFSPVE